LVLSLEGVLAAVLVLQGPGCVVRGFRVGSQPIG
jgi:hypothetical protein